MWGWGGQETPQTQTADTGQLESVVDLSDQLQQQQQLITQLKEMVRGNEKTLHTKEKELEENASKLSKIKLQHKAKVSQLTNQLQEAQKKLTFSGTVLPGGTSTKPDEDDDASSEGSHASHTEQTNRGRLLLLKKKLEESRSAFEKRETEVQKQNQDIEEVVGNLRKQLHERDETITKLHSNAPTRATNVASSNDRDQDSSGSQQMYAQIVYKDTKILELNNRIMELEANVMDLQENVREKDEVIQSQNKAIQLMAEDLSRKGKATVDQLDDTKDEMRQMQQTFVTMESCWKEERERLVGELETSKEKYIIDAAEKENRICDLKETLNKLEAARFDLSARNAALQEKVVVLQERLEKVRVSRQSGGGDVETLLKEVKDLRSKLEEKEQRIRDLQSAVDSDKSSGGKSVVKLKAQYVTRIKALDKQLAEAKQSAKPTDLHQLQQQIAELEDEKGNLQLKLVDFDDLKAAEAKHQEHISELKIKLNQQSDELTNHVRMVSLLQQEKMDFAESLAKAKQELSSVKEHESTLSDAKVALEMKVVELEESRDGLEERSTELLHEIHNLKENLENEKRPVMAIEVEKDALQIKLNELTEAHQDKESRILNLAEELANATDAKTALEHKVHQMENDMSFVEEQIQTKEAVFGEVSAKQKKVQDLLSVFCEEHGILEPTVDQMSSKWDDLLSAQQHLQNEVSRFCHHRGVNTLEELEGVWDMLKQNEVTLEQEVKKHQADLSFVQEQMSQLQNAFEELESSTKTQKEEFNATINKLAQGNEAFSISVADKDNQLLKSAQELQDMKAESSRLEGELSKLTTQVDVAKDENMRLSMLLMEKNVQIEQFDAIVANKDKDLNDLRNQLVQNETRIEAITVELNAKSEALTKMEEKLHLNDNVNEKLHQQMEAANQSFVEQLSDMEQEVTRLQTIVDEKETLVCALQNQRDQLSNTAEGLTQALNSSKEEIHALTLQKDTDITCLQQQNQEIQELKRIGHEKELQWQADSSAKLQTIENLNLDLENSKEICEDIVKNAQLLVEEKNQDLDALQDEVCELKSRLQEVKEGLSDKEQLRAKLELDLSEQLRKGEVAAETMVQLEEKVEQDKQKIDALLKRNSELEASVETSSQVIVDLEKSIEEREASNHFLKEQLEMKGKDSEENVVSLQREHQRLDNLLEQKSTELQQMNSELQDLNSVIKQLREENNENIKAENVLQMSLDTQISKNQQLENEINDLNRKLSETMHVSDQLRTHISNVEYSSQELQNGKQQLEQKVVELQEVVAHVQHEKHICKEKLTQSVNTLGNSNSELKNEIDEYKDKCIRLQQELDIIAQEFSAALKKSDETEAALFNIQQEVSSANDTVSSQLVELQEYSRRLTDSDKRSAELEEDLSKSMNQVASFTERLQVAESEVTKQHSDRIKLENAYQCTLEQLDNEKQSLALISNEVAEMCDIKCCLEVKVEEADLKITHMSTSLQESTKLNEQLQSQLSSVNSELDDLKVNSSQEIGALNNRLYDLEKRLVETENTNKNEHSMKMKRLEDEKAELFEKASSLEQQLEQAQLQLIEQGRLTMHLEAEADNMPQLKENLTAIQDQNDVLKKTIQELECTRDTLQAENMKFQQSINQTSERNEKMSVYAEQLEADLQSIQASWENANQEKNQLQEELTANKSLLVSEIEREKLLDRELVNLQEEHQEFCDQTSLQLKEAEAQLEMRKVANTEKQTKIDSLVTESDLHATNMRLLQDSCQQYLNSIEQLKNELSALQVNMESKQQEVNHSAEQVQTVTQIVRDLEKTIAAKQSEVETNVQLVDDLQRALTCKDSAIEVLQGENNTQLDLLAQSKKEVALKQDEIIRLENDVQTYSQNILRMQSTLNSFMESEGNKEEDRNKLVEQLNQLEAALSQERTDRCNLEIRFAEVAEIKGNMKDVSIQVDDSDERAAQTLAVGELHAENELLQKTVIEMQQQADKTYSDNVKETEALSCDIEQMKLYIEQQNKLIDAAQNEKVILEKKVRKLAENLRIDHEDYLDDIVSSLQKCFDSLEEKNSVLQVQKFEAYELFRDMVLHTLGEDASEITIDEAKRAWMDRQAQIETLSAAMEEANASILHLQQEVTMLQNEKQNLLEANKQWAERDKSNTAVCATDVVDAEALDFVDKCLEEVSDHGGPQQEYHSIEIGGRQEVTYDALQHENMLLQSEINNLKGQLSQLIENQETATSQRAFTWGMTVERGVTAQDHSNQGVTESATAHSHEQQLRDILQLIVSDGSHPASFQEARQVLEAQSVKLEILTTAVLESELRISRLQEDISMLQEENRNLMQANDKFQKQLNISSSPIAKLDEIAVEQCLHGLEGDWMIGNDEPFVNVEVTTGQKMESTDSITKAGTSQPEIEMIEQENLALKEEVRTLKARLSDMISREETNVEKRAIILGATETCLNNTREENLTYKEEDLVSQSMLHHNSAVAKHVTTLGSAHEESPTDNVYARNYAVNDVLKLIFPKVPENVSLEQVKYELERKDDELEHLSASLLEMDVKVENLQMIIQSMEEEKKSMLDALPGTLNVPKPTSCVDDESVTTVLELIESHSSLVPSSGSPSSNIKDSLEESKMENKACDIEQLLKENLALKDEVSSLKTKLSEMVERSEVTVAKQGYMLGSAFKESELINTKSILDLIFNEDVVDPNLDDVKIALQQKNDRLDELTAMLLEGEVAISNLELEIEALKLEHTKVNKLKKQFVSNEVNQPSAEDNSKDALKEFSEHWTDSKFDNSEVNKGLVVVGHGDILSGYSFSKEEFEELVNENHNLKMLVADLQKRLCLIVEKTETATAHRASVLGSVESDETSCLSAAAEPTLSSVDSDVLSMSPVKENTSMLDMSADSRCAEIRDEIERLRELNDGLESKLRIAEDKLAKSQEIEERLALVSADLKTTVQEKDACLWAIDELKAENDDLVTRIQESNAHVKRLQQALQEEKSQWDRERLALSQNAKPVSASERHSENLQLSDNTDTATLSTNYARVTEELGILKVKNGKMLAKLKQFKDKNDQLQKLLNDVGSIKTETSTVVDDLRSTIDMLSQEKASVEVQLSIYSNENNVLKTELNLLKDKCELVEGSNTLIEHTESSSQELINSALQAESDELKHRVTDLLDVNHNLTLENEKLKRVANDSNERSEALLSDNTTFQMLVENSKTTKAKLDAELKNQVTLLFHANEENKKLQKSIESLELSVLSYKDLAEKYRKLETEWQATKAALVETEKSVDEVRHKFQQLHRENETLRKDKVELELKLNTDLNDQEKINAYTKEIKQLTDKFKKAQQGNEQLLSESKSMHKQISQYQEEIEDLRTKANSLEQLLEGYKEQVEADSTIPPQVAIVNESRQFAPNKTEQLFADESYIHEKLEQAERDRTKLQQSVGTLTASVQEMKAELELNISEKNSLLYKLEGWRDQSEKLNAENEELRKRHQRLEDANEQLETEKQSLMQQLHQMKGELEQAQWLCQRQNEEVATLKAVTEKQHYDLKNLSQQNEAMLLSVQQLTAEKQSLEATSSSLQQEITQLKSSNDSLTQQSDNWRKHLNSISSNLTLPDANAPSEIEAKTVEPSVTLLQAELHQSMQSLHRRNQRCEELSEELSLLLEERDDLQLRLSAFVRNQQNKDTQMQQLQRRLEDQEELAHSAVVSQAVSYHSSLDKVELGLEMDDRQPLMHPATSYTLTRTMASTSWRIQSWLQGRSYNGRQVLHV